MNIHPLIYRSFHFDQDYARFSITVDFFLHRSIETIKGKFKQNIPVHDTSLPDMKNIGGLHGLIKISTADIRVLLEYVDIAFVLQVRNDTRKSRILVSDFCVLSLI